MGKGAVSGGGERRWAAAGPPRGAAARGEEAGAGAGARARARTRAEAALALVDFLDGVLAILEGGTTGRGEKNDKSDGPTVFRLFTRGPCFLAHRRIKKQTRGGAVAGAHRK